MQRPSEVIEKLQKVVDIGRGLPYLDAPYDVRVLLQYIIHLEERGRPSKKIIRKNQDITFKINPLNGWIVMESPTLGISSEDPTVQGALQGFRYRLIQMVNSGGIEFIEEHV